MKKNNWIIIGMGLLLVAVLGYFFLKKKKETGQTTAGEQNGPVYNHSPEAKAVKQAIDQVAPTILEPVPSASSAEVDEQFEKLMKEITGSTSSTTTTTGKMYAGADGSTSDRLQNLSFRSISAEIALKNARAKAEKAKNSRRGKTKKIRNK